MNKLPAIGTSIQWYGQASRTMAPQAAIVIAHSGDLLKLMTVDAFGVQRVREQVRHVDDPFLKDNQIWRVNYGGWDYIPQEQASMPEQETSARAVGPGAKGAKTTVV